MITAELTENEKKKDLLSLAETAGDAVEAIRKIFPGRKVEISIDDDAVDYWLDGNCYSVNRSFYFPKD